MSIRIRTGYSFRSAVGKIPDVIDTLKTCGFQFAPITDTASTFGWTKWRKASTKAGLHPVYGVELAVTRAIHEKRPSVDYWTFIATDSIVPINEHVSTATQQFRYQPLLRVDQAVEDVGVNVIMGHRTNFDEIDPAPHLYFALGPSTPAAQIRRALRKGHQPVAACDNRYPAPGQVGFYETVAGRFASTQSYPQWIMSDGEWREYTSKLIDDPAVLDAALANRNKIARHCVADLVKAEMVHPPRPATLLDMCQRGAAELGVDLTDPAYAERLSRELDLIAAKNFEDYFYLVADICQWARERMIVGPARGSSCGSLVCYLLKITTVDPLPYGLLFERFIDINRNDMPDIDIDFPEDRRNEVFEHIAKTYGREKVARLGTVNMYQPRSALKEAAASLDIPQWSLTPVIESLIDRKAGDSRANKVIEDTLAETAAGKEFTAKWPEIAVAGQMEGHPRHAGQHAAGIVITEKPVLEYVAIDQRTGAAMCDKRDAEELNLLKVDALGLTQLSVFEQTAKLAGLPLDFLKSVPLDDPAAFEVLNSRKYAGVFQFNGLALQNITNRIRITELNDIVAVTALARPGPLQSGGTEHWIKVKTGEEVESYPHPLFEPHLKSTLGVVAYQEQVMMIGREIGGLSWEDVTALRKAMSKSMGREYFDQYGDKWKAGAIERGVPQDVAARVWDELTTYGAWAFNLSHAVAYGLMSYYCCWLKAHHPLEFAAATLTYMGDPEEQVKMLRELAAEGVDYLPVDPGFSTNVWAVKREGERQWLVGPLSNVKGIGPKMMSSIIGARKRGEPMPDRAQKLLTNPKTKIDSLWPIDAAFKRMIPDLKAANILTEPMRVKDIVVTGIDYEAVALVVVTSIKVKDENSEEAVAKRGGRKFTGPTTSLVLKIADDTEEMFAKISRWDFERIGRGVVDKGRPGKSMYVVKGHVPKDFRILNIKKIKYIGDTENE